MEHEKDYSLLRPFDSEAVKRGEDLCDEFGNALTYIAGPDNSGMIVFDRTGEYFLRRAEALYMAPLAWVEAKPVYKGDVLWHPAKGKCKVDVVTKISGGAAACHEGGCFSIKFSSYADELTWTPPKVKREGWVVVLPEMVLTEAQAKHIASASGTSIAARIEWEEPATQEGGAA